MIRGARGGFGGEKLLRFVEDQFGIVGMVGVPSMGIAELEGLHNYAVLAIFCDCAKFRYGTFERRVCFGGESFLWDTFNFNEPQIF